jgi:thiamine-phosphate pyrophosphorylase
VKYPQLRGLYAITDESLIPASGFAAAVQQCLEGGVRIIQYRDKSADAHKRVQQAQQLRALCRAHQALLIINDDIELAAAVAADGVHLGRDDDAIRHARHALGAHAIIGASCYNQFALAQQAVAAGANYIAFGAFFPSPTKPQALRANLELLAQARTLGVPVCAIGGITLENAGTLIEAGADMLAVISALFDGEDIARRSADFNALCARTCTGLDY